MAQAGHNSDLHSPNARLIAELDLGGAQSDIAFWGDRAIVGFHGDPREPGDDGFRVVDISHPEKPRVEGAFTCADSFWDLSAWEDIVVVSVNALLAGSDCDPEANPGDDFAGLRIVSIANPKRPVQLAAVPQCVDDMRAPGSHNNTIVPDLDRARLIVYSSGSCPAVVEVPLAAPATARLVRYLDVGPDVGCHDITVHVARRLAWCGATRSQLWSLEDLENPRRVGLIENPVIAQHHSVVFSADGNAIALSDERARLDPDVCFGGTLEPEGALWFYDVTNPATPILRSYHQLAQERITGFCSAHQATLVPLPGERDVLSIGWFRGGMELIDFTNLAAPEVLAHYIATPKDPERFGFAWSAFWYRGRVYVTNTAWRGTHLTRSHRGLDVLRVDHPMLREAIDLPHLNAQTQEPLQAGARSQQPHARSQPGAQRPGGGRGCSRGRFRLRGLPRAEVLRAALWQRGRRVRRLRTPRRRSVLVDLRALRPAVYTVRVTIRSRDGRRRLVARTYRVCQRRS